ncbi:MAG: Dps family protein [Pseudomonadota bacterium]
MTNKPVIGRLKILLADSYSLYLKTQNYHWNVTGPHFKSLHELFEAQYNDLAAAVDEIAERIRALGEKAPGSWQAFESLSTIQSGDENANATTMLQDLIKDQDVLIKTLRDVLEASQNVGDEATSGLVTDRMMVHEKAKWMLASSL